MPSPAELPNLRASIRLGDKGDNVGTCFYDVKFYPYALPGKDLLFAVTGDKHTIVCRPVLEKDNAIEVLRWFVDEETNEDGEPNASLNSLEWTQDFETGEPLVCVTGSNPKIKLLNVRTGALVKTLTGHGSLVNDLAVSPLTPHILASCSEDYTVRIWCLDPKYEKQPCALMCAGGLGEGHKEAVLTIAWHRTGRYLLSGGMDTVVNMWVIPDLPNEDTGTDNMTIIHYPHFSTTEIHRDYVDCVRFYNDLIISRSAKENKILLWRIDGFNSSHPPPPSASAPPKTSSSPPTRSAFGARFQRLLQFEAPLTNLFYMRFGLFHAPEKHPVLVMGNERSKLFFWDLQALEEGVESGDPTLGRGGRGGYRGRGKGAVGSGRQGVLREESIASNVSGVSSNVGSVGVSSATSTGSGGERKWNIGDPFRGIVAHKSITVGKVTFATRAIAWSGGGEWCVAVGDNGMICLFRRWE
ncbi:hypothetical protein W97_05292 [Coniosporium apollinis CBS 100218]|uniref:Uncharacterized protein n=1 Tax=Coniosporium apollinis (strain CBS 100218) TaxID=1168221 RepID=R7YW64_CONA1|nr:uncharacterized protein W97_05292 [Coniosporium apollinis CBS 100218]EON66049.1 hypothetical protein W97_05292 [Coniosporium apollinis CBS 100218]